MVYYLKVVFTYYVKKIHGIEIETNNFFNYPIIMKNYISNNLYFGGLFLKHDLDFFTSKFFIFITLLYNIKVFI